MGNSEEVKPSGSEKSSSPTLDQNNVHVYPDWAAMQAYYGPRLAVPPYMNSAVASPHAPLPYMWAPPQSMIPPPYGTPYAAFYAHGGIYAHPGVPVAGATMSMEAPVKSSGNADGGFVKKLKEFDGLAISIGNGNSDYANHRQSDSDETNDSSDGSNGVASGAGRDGKKRSRQGSPSKGDGKCRQDSSSAPTMEVDQTSEKMAIVIPALKDPSLSLKSSPSNGPQPSNEREMKRERRKQSNRESARRSRLRKQAETEELAAKVQALSSENMTLTSELSKLVESSKKLKHENLVLMEKLKATQVGEIEDVELHKIDKRLKPVSTVNLLERVNNNDDPGISSRSNEDSESYDNNRGPGAKLRQLLDTNPRTDAVAAS